MSALLIRDSQDPEPAIASVSLFRVAFSKFPYTLLVTSKDECPRCLESQKIGRYRRVRDDHASTRRCSRVG